MPLMNYSTRVEVHRTASEITTILVRHGASRIVQDFDGSGNVVALKWSLDGRYGTLGHAMPLNYEAVYDVLTDEGLIFQERHRPAEGAGPSSGLADTERLD